MSVPEVVDSLVRFGERYTHRLFTLAERTECEAGGGSTGCDLLPVIAARYAARFAAKESVMKVLRPIETAPQWRMIETRRGPSGALTVGLIDDAAQLAVRQGIYDIAISITHEGAYAAAVAVAQYHPGGFTRDRSKKWKSVFAKYWPTGRG